ncbi:MAG: sulfatase-like hydrolase/transferase [Akkermansiaceae bacterium]|nr:sulfatase-like hydrolase/transferase [Akkermansiaceae bacterium]
MKILVVLLMGMGWVQGEWVELFDGKSTKGWTPRAKVEQFEAKNGELYLMSKLNVWVTSDIQMSDFEAELEVMLPEYEGFNSGLAFRCQGAKGKPRGYQIEIDRKIPGGVYGIGLGGWLGKEKGVLKEGEWNHFRVMAEGERIRTWVNGKLVSDLKDGKQLKGYFGIQHHGKGGVVKFRNIRAREIAAKTGKVERPNILWIVAEDMSPTLGCYGGKDAITPNLDAFAKESILYTHAFAAYPVCSPSRSCLITGMYPTTTGTGQMRSAFPLPKGTRGFPEYLRDAGYYTTNNVKTDYNSADAGRLVEACWDESSAKAHWRGKREGQSFFAVFNDMTSHQSRTMVWPHEVFQKEVQSKLSPDEIHDPKEVRVPSYYPDTPVVRKGLARYHDCVTAMDKNVGRILKELEEDGLAEETIVFFYSDHGSGMPRHKRLLTDSGMRVPLMIRVPKKWRHLVGGSPKDGEKTDRLVSFVDFAPTVLSLAGLEVPKVMSKSRVIGKGEKREWVYGARDRVDEVFDCSRSVRNGRWLYIRNYHPHYSWNQRSVFSDLGEIRQEMYRYQERGMKLSAGQAHYLLSSRKAEEFYDCEADPENIRNILDQKMTSKEGRALGDARRALRRLRGETGDVGCLPEGVMADWVNNSKLPIADAIVGKELVFGPYLNGVWEVADSVGRNVEVGVKALSSDDSSKRFWGVISLRDREIGKPVKSLLIGLLKDPVADVRIEAAALLAQRKASHPSALKVLVNELDNSTWAVALRACRAIEMMGEDAKSVLPEMKAVYARTRHEKGDENFFLAFSSGAFLEKLGEKTDPWDFTPGAGSFMPPKKK